MTQATEVPLERATWEAAPAAERVRLAILDGCTRGLATAMACSRGAEGFAWDRPGDTARPRERGEFSDQRPFLLAQEAHLCVWEDVEGSARLEGQAVTVAATAGVDVERIVAAHLRWEHIEERRALGVHCPVPR